MIPADQGLLSTIRISLPAAAVGLALALHVALLPAGARAFVRWRVDRAANRWMAAVAADAAFPSQGRDE